MSEFKRIREGGDKPLRYAEESAKALKTTRDYRCAFASDGQRCPEAGTITDVAIGPGVGQTDHRRWLCRWHYDVRNDPEGGRLVLLDLLAHRQPHQDWRDKLVSDFIANNRDNPLMARSLLIGEGKGDDADKLDLLRDLQLRSRQAVL